MIGYAGSDDKVKYLVDELGFDYAFNYKKEAADKWKSSLKQSAPNGVDCYFDNVTVYILFHIISLLLISVRSFRSYPFIAYYAQVGGHLSTAIRSHMAPYGRISVCGAVSNYNETAPTMAPCPEPILVFRQIRMEGFLINRWVDRFDEGLLQMSQWIQEVTLIN